MEIAFAESARSSLGVEWELALVDADSGELRQVAQTILEAAQEVDPASQLMGELLMNTLEVRTGVCKTVAEAGADLNRSLELVAPILEPMRVQLMSAGTHPFSHWGTQKVTNKARYAKLIDRTQWWGRQMLIFGVHVHVGVDHRDKVLPIIRGLLPYLPHLQALSASSPYWDGRDTGYASNRALMFQQLPTAGLPFQFGEWSELERYTKDLIHTGVIDVFNEIRWDIRPSPQFGTIEVRVCDGLPTMREVLAVAAFIQCLVDDISQRLDDGETFGVMSPWFVQENKWRSARYGMDAIVILNSEGDEELVSDHLSRELERLAPVAQRLGCTEELGWLNDILRRGASYQRQRAVARRNSGALGPVVESLVAEFAAGRPL